MPPLLLPLELERLLRRSALHHRDRLARHGEHQFSQLAEAFLVFRSDNGHKFAPEQRGL
jgi:hypothetical protein